MLMGIIDDHCTFPGDDLGHVSSLGDPGDCLACLQGRFKFSGPPSDFLYFGGYLHRTSPNQESQLEFF